MLLQSQINIIFCYLSRGHIAKNNAYEMNTPKYLQKKRALAKRINILETDVKQNR